MHLQMTRQHHSHMIAAAIHRRPLLQNNNHLDPVHHAANVLRMHQLGHAMYLSPAVASYIAVQTPAHTAVCGTATESHCGRQRPTKAK